MIGQARELLDAAGWVGAALLVVSAVLWFLVVLRALALRAGTDEGELSAHRDMIRALVAAAPLLGLLGTVGGMIETFASLHRASAVGTGGSVAGGIEVALVSTQLGLAIGIPGLVAAVILERREQRLREEEPA